MILVQVLTYPLRVCMNSKLNKLNKYKEREKRLLYKVLFWLDCASDLSSFCKTATLG